MRSIEIFAGAGGCLLGVEAADFQSELAVEFDKWACETLRRNHPELDVFEGKVEDVPWERLAGENIDLLAGGPPCQDFSSAGKGLGEHGARNGFPAALDAVRKMRPRAFLFENVKGLTTKKHRPYLDRIVAEFQVLGYSVQWKVLDAADFGVPQRRHRIFIVGFRSDVDASTFQFPEPTHSLNALVWAKWVDRSYWREHGTTQVDREFFDGANEAHQRNGRMLVGNDSTPGSPVRASGTLHSIGNVKTAESTRDERRVIEAIAGGQGRDGLARWRTVRDAIGDLIGCPSAIRMEQVGASSSSSDLPSPTQSVVGNCYTSEKAGVTRRVGDRVANHDPSAPVKASETRPEWLAKHPSAKLDEVSPSVRTGHRDAGTMTIANHDPNTTPIIAARNTVVRPSSFAGLLYDGYPHPWDTESPAGTVPAIAGGNHTPFIANHAPVALSVLITDRIASGEVDTSLQKHPPRRMDDPSSAVESNLARGGYYGMVKTPTLRRLSVRECARLQDFLDRIVFMGPKTAQYKQVGNACPPKLAEVVAREIAKVLKG